MHRGHRGDGHPVAGDRCLGNPRELRPDRPGAQHQVLLPGQGGQHRQHLHHLRHGAQLHDHRPRPPPPTRRPASRPREPPSTARSTTRATGRARSPSVQGTTTSSSTCTDATSVTATQSPVSGASATPVSDALTGLTPNTKYEFQVAANSTGAPPSTARCSSHDHTRGPDRHNHTRPPASRPRRPPSTAQSTTRTTPRRAVSFCYKDVDLLDMHRGHRGDGHPVAGDRCLDNPRELRPDRPDAQHQVLLPGQGGQHRQHLHHLRRGEDIHDHPAPTATTDAATSVTATSATLNGTVNNENNTSTTVTFCYKTTSLSSTCTGPPGDGHPVAVTGARPPP